MADPAGANRSEPDAWAVRPAATGSTDQLVHRLACRGGRRLSGLGPVPPQLAFRHKGQPYLFLLFPTKKALFLTIVRRCFQQLAQVFAAAAAGRLGEDALQAMGSAFGQLCKQRTLPLMQVHAYAACSDPEIQAATRAAFRELRITVERLTGLPPAQVQRWFGLGMLMTATTAMDLQAADNRRSSRCPGAGKGRAPPGRTAGPDVLRGIAGTGRNALLPGDSWTVGIAPVGDRQDKTGPVIDGVEGAVVHRGRCPGHRPARCALRSPGRTRRR